MKDNSTIFLDSGSTTVHILPHLAERSNITVITHSLSALYEAAKSGKFAGKVASKAVSYILNALLTIMLIGLITGIIVCTVFAVYV